MRPGLTITLAALPLLAAGCEPVMLGLAGASIPVFHRSPVDMAVSATSGRDCSIVNLDKGQRYCLPRDPPPAKPLFCTRSLGVPDCWENPAKLPNNPKEIADGPRELTPEQEADRTARWPRLF